MGRLLCPGSRSRIRPLAGIVAQGKTAGTERLHQPKKASTVFEPISAINDKWAGAGTIPEKTT
jgi:hypothetical protein